MKPCKGAQMQLGGHTVQVQLKELEARATGWTSGAGAVGSSKGTLSPCAKQKSYATQDRAEGQ